MIVKTDAIVLSSMKYRDTSKIVRLYTREFGRLSVIAKGARESKSKFRSALEPMNFVSCVIYKNDNRELQLLSQCDVVHAFRRLTDDPEKMHAAITALELVDLVTHDEEQNEGLYVLISNLLHTVNNATKNSTVALYWFEVRLSDLLGFRPELKNCTNCENTLEVEMEEGQRFAMASAGILCAACAHAYAASSALSAGTLRVLQRLQDAETTDSIMNIHMSPSNQDEARQSLQQHFRRHVEGFRGLKSEEVFAAIL